jgi:hypothetical protein
MQNRAASPARESYESTTQAIELTGARWAFKPAMAARPRVAMHHASRRRGGCLAGRGMGAAAGDAGGRSPPLHDTIRLDERHNSRRHPTRRQRALTCCDQLCDVLSPSAGYRRAAEGHGYKWLGTCGPNLRLSDLLFFPREAAWPPDSFAERNEAATLLLPAASNRPSMVG